MERNTIQEMKSILDAIEQGKAIQRCCDVENNKWEDFVTLRPNFGYNIYRIKPEEPKKKWRPFKNVDEFIKAAGGLGAIWLKRKTDGVFRIVTALENNCVTCIRLSATWESFESIFRDWTFTDGTPCGVEEDA